VKRSQNTANIFHSPDGKTTRRRIWGHSPFKAIDPYVVCVSCHAFYALVDQKAMFKWRSVSDLPRLLQEKTAGKLLSDLPPGHGAYTDSINHTDLSCNSQGSILRPSATRSIVSPVDQGANPG
jgi:hypothetical protein